VDSLRAFRISLETLEDACVLRVGGELDLSTAGQLRAQLEAVRGAGLTALLDMSGVRFIDSSGLRVLLEAARAADAHEWAWFIVRPSAAVLELIEVSGTESRLPLVVPRDGATAGDLARRSRAS
jgi:anti-sigma B factor antagonist